MVEISLSLTVYKRYLANRLSNAGFEGNAQVAEQNLGPFEVIDLEGRFFREIFENRCL